ncbi:MAG: hypothetical protein P4L83_05145 [Nevskia sp.]|nr:hypothetical protein [Nevskia sp.]
MCDGKTKSTRIKPAGPRRLLKAAAGIAMMAALLDGGAAWALGAGSLDPSFGKGGIATTGTSTNVVLPLAAIEQPGGDIVVVSQYRSASGTFLSLMRYLPNGTLDTRFGQNGTTLTAFDTGPGFSITPTQVALLSSGDIVVVGSAANGGGSSGSPTFAFALARYTPNGALDTSFGTGGQVTTIFGGSAGAYVSAMLVDPNGNILVGGTNLILGPTRATAKNFMVLARYKPNGTLDPTFGAGGIVQTIPTPDLGPSFSLVALSNGSYLAVDDGTGALEFSSTGVLQSMVTPGPVAVSTPPPGYAVSNTMLLQPNGDSLVATTVQIARQRFDAQVVLYGETGAVDSSFNSAPFIFGTAVSKSEPVGIAVQSNGQIVVAGIAHTNTGPDELGLARLNSDGELDPTFGIGGTVLTAFFPYTMLLQTDGKIVVVGSSSVAGSSNTAVTLARYLTN